MESKYTCTPTRDIFFSRASVKRWSVNAVVFSFFFLFFERGIWEKFAVERALLFSESFRVNKMKIWKVGVCIRTCNAFRFLIEIIINFFRWISDHKWKSEFQHRWKMCGTTVTDGLTYVTSMIYWYGNNYKIISPCLPWKTVKHDFHYVCR